eukprot:630297-Rhodomonas_salina.1
MDSISPNPGTTTQAASTVTRACRSHGASHSDSVTDSEWARYLRPRVTGSLGAGHRDWHRDSA